jgi:hypothetical protein
MTHGDVNVKTKKTKLVLDEAMKAQGRSRFIALLFL